MMRSSLAYIPLDISKVLEAMTESFLNLVQMMDLAIFTMRALSGGPRHMLESSNDHCTMQVSLMPRTCSVSALSMCLHHAMAS